MSRVIFCGVSLLAMFSVGCGVDDAAIAGDDTEPSLDAEASQELGNGRGVLAVRFAGLEPLGDDFVYEGWLVIDGQPITAGRFNLTASNPNRILYFYGPAAKLRKATTYVLTIEPKVGDDPAPAATHVLAGDLPAIGRTRRARLTLKHGAAFGTDFEGASGSYLLATPSSEAMDDSQFGIWFVDPTLPGGPGPSLQLPELPAGWAYEGWVVTSGGPLSTGTFRSTSGLDDDGAGPTAGPKMGPPFPGQDFITPPVNLRGKRVVISIEPSPDDSPAPFALKPLSAVTPNNFAVGTPRNLVNQMIAETVRGAVAVFLP